ncbi:unnamed protein product [Chrysoparadoxa australica]
MSLLGWEDRVIEGDTPLGVSSSSYNDEFGSFLGSLGVEENFGLFLQSELDCGTQVELQPLNKICPSDLKQPFIDGGVRPPPAVAVIEAPKVDVAKIAVAKTESKKRPLAKDAEWEGEPRKTKTTATKAPRRPVRTAHEKAQANRDRNREHARNTRMRKKAYLEGLKKTVEELIAEKQQRDLSSRAVASNRNEQENIRKQVLSTFFNLRANGNLSRSAWEAVAEEGLTFSLPVTPYRSFSALDVVQNKRIILGIDAVIKDTASLGELVSTVKKCCGETVQCSLRQEETAVVGDSIMCRWVWKWEGECCTHGMLMAQFSPANKLVCVEEVFDVMSLLRQLQELTSGGVTEFPLIPNASQMYTLQSAA